LKTPQFSVAIQVLFKKLQLSSLQEKETLKKQIHKIMAKKQNTEISSGCFLKNSAFKRQPLH